VDGLVERLASSGVFVSYCTAFCEVAQCRARSWRVEFYIASEKKGIEFTLTGGTAAVRGPDHFNLVSRLGTSGVLPSLPVCVHGASREKFSFTVCVSVLLF
jgi:hypothetical protein